MRDLTPNEEKKILAFWKLNPDKDSSDVVKIFEKHLGIEITEKRVIKIADDDMRKRMRRIASRVVWSEAATYHESVTRELARCDHV